MGTLDGRISIITGAGRGLGRAHALLFAAEGAQVVVNDRGADDDDRGAAEAVVEEITAAGGAAVANHDDVTDWEGGQRLIETAVATFGGLDVLVNNAGILRDRALVNMTEEDWDDVTTVHLKGHFVPTRWAATYWREQSKAGTPRRASLIHTSSTSGLLGNPGQTNYGAAKAGVAAFAGICAQELGRYGVRSNCIVPAARTRLTEATPGLSDMVAAPDDGAGFDVWDPGNVSPVVAYLASAACEVSDRTLFVQGGTVRVMEGWRFGQRVEQERRWSVDALAEALDPLL
ncbi:MAG: SDR family oxidoreductase [Acidimicrobiales bacterium]|nr:SDR family oxidoreductase [Acidimicrobiales bacterium]